MATPPPKAKSGAGPKTCTIEEKQQLLDNFDLEGEYFNFPVFLTGHGMRVQETDF
jgi:hypothetical protein